jgi:hypothetical protein
MSALLQAIDSFTPSNAGENGHSEHTWSHDTQELISQLSFQMVRTNKSQISALASTLRSLLQRLSVTQTDNANRIAYIRILYCMIGQTRDIIDGKGEYALAYMQILVWHEFYPELARFALETFVSESAHKSAATMNTVVNDSDEPAIPLVTHQYGSWKDIKHICAYIKEVTNNPNHPLIQHAVIITNEQLHIDAHENNNKHITLLGKWVARQTSSKHGWLFTKLAVDYFKEYITTARLSDIATRTETIKRATTKAKMDYRKIVTSLNLRLDTIQIKQCGNHWADIDHSKTTSITVTKQKKALLNLTKKGEPRSESEDRVTCAENFKTFISSLIKEGKEVKGARVGMVDFVKSGLAGGEQIELDILNSQWRDNSKQTKSLEDVIVMVDTSGSMNGDPLLAAIGLGIRIAEKSTLGKRVLTFSELPRWVNLEGCNTFTEMLATINYSDWGNNTNFYKALDLILDSIKASPTITRENCEKMILAILSDMQIDQGDRNWKSMYAGIEAKYAAVGIEKFGMAIRPPHILFWNLRSTGGFPTLSSQPNASMMSGFSPALLNLFCEKGIDALQSCTPWSLLCESLDKPRYSILSDRMMLEFA